MRIENSPGYEAKMKRKQAEWEREAKKRKATIEKARADWRSSGGKWLPMDDCPFAALEEEYGLDGTILVANGKERALATVGKRFGRPIFWITPPEYVIRDGMPCLVGGEEDPRPDLPKWYWEWELTDINGMMTYAGGEETGREEVGFLPTHWTFLQEF